MNVNDDSLIIGAGLAGLTAGWQAAAHGRRVRVIAFGWGATHWHAGCIDVLGYDPLDSQEPLLSPADALPRFIANNPHHPYALIGLDGVAEALDAFRALLVAAGYPLHGSLDRNWLLPSAAGAIRPTCLAPETMIAGDLSHPAPMLLVGFKQLGDFYPHLAADNLSRQGFPAGHVTLDLETLRRRRFTNPVIMERLMGQADFRAEVVDALQAHLGRAERVGFPAVFSLDQPIAVQQDLEARLGRAVFEIPTLPPSIAGMRLQRLLARTIEAHGGRVYDAMKVVGAERAGGRITAVHSEAAARHRTLRAARYVLATGGILGGGIETDHQGHVRETIFDLPLAAPADRAAWFRLRFLDRLGHPIYRSGVAVDADFRPLNGDGRPAYDNLWAAGSTLAHCELIRERSFEGVAVATGYQVGRAL